MTYTMIDNAVKTQTIMDELFVSTEKPQIESIFNKYDVEETETRIELLRLCMKVADISNFGGTVSLAQEYEGELAIFIEGSWRFLI